MCEYKDAAKGVFYGSSRNKLSGLENQSDEQSGETNSSSNTSEQQENNKKLCFFKFYHFNDSSDKNLRKKFFKSYSDVLLFYGATNIHEILSVFNSNSDSLTKYRFIYSHRHMGLTSFLKALETVWKGEYSGRNQVYAGEFQGISRKCKVVTFLPSKDGDADGKTLAELIITDIEKWKDKINFLQNGQCPCSAIEDVVIQGISSLLRKQINKMGESQYKRLLLLDDFDAFLCHYYEQNGGDERFYWFYRKCWLKAVVTLNMEKKLNAVVATGVLTHFIEYKDENESEFLDNPCAAIGIKKYEIFDLHLRYRDILRDLGDACFFQCPTAENACGMLSCNGSFDKCRFALEGRFQDRKVPGEECLKDKNHIREIVLGDRYKECNDNPWWLIVPLCHVFERGNFGHCEEIDKRIKAYYQFSNRERPSGPLLEEFGKLFPMFCNPKYNCKKLKNAKAVFQKSILMNAKRGNAQMNLKRTSKKGKNSSGENKIIKRMFHDSGLIYKQENTKDDMVNINPFVVYVYSGTKIFECQ